MEPHYRTGTLAFRQLVGRDFTAISKCAEGINK
jgi:hypothetical protein